MRRPTFISPNNGFRKWARRLTRVGAARPDVVAGQLARRIELLERVAGVATPGIVAVSEAVSLLKPSQSPSIELQRLGSPNDGGYVLPDLVWKQGTGVVSIGVGSDNSCDVALAQRGLIVHAWDHTIGKLPMRHPRITFHKTGLGVGEDLLSLGSIADTSFGPGSSRLVLMIDAEGAEWDQIRDADAELLQRFDVVAVEFHDLGDILVDPEPQLSALRALHALFQPVAVHVNNHGAVWRVGAFEWPDALEVTYVRRDACNGPFLSGNCPADLFAPCCIDLPDPDVGWLVSGR